MGRKVVVKFEVEVDAEKSENQQTENQIMLQGTTDEIISGLVLLIDETCKLTSTDVKMLLKYFEFRLGAESTIFTELFQNIMGWGYEE